nr:uncharacterized protein LOC127341184 [Lolium perenne]XP_051222926.1 uncharacterized protein LOC127341184 [Lolium perenne]XP_051222927.1 uncharacterized protein LOC127341184 [Lolium perenne]XP_051222929.1 uncharacterized protein LOC127341184 [Lolium perenne]XP_051222930.1 uncharacterized protein LOC127341184 [Lolium perenne]XP_051222931.1 uncharacterized protein LOC127341184 [Lolium perenne]
MTAGPIPAWGRLFETVSVRARVDQKIKTVKTLASPRATSPQSRASLSSSNPILPSPKPDPPPPPHEGPGHAQRRPRGGTCGGRTRSWRRAGGKRRRHRSAAPAWGKIEASDETLATEQRGDSAAMEAPEEVVDAGGGEEERVAGAEQVRLARRREAMEGDRRRRRWPPRCPCFICSSKGLLPALPRAIPLSSISAGRTASSAAAATSAAPVERPGGRGGEHQRRFVATPPAGHPWHTILRPPTSTWAKLSLTVTLTFRTHLQVNYEDLVLHYLLISLMWVARRSARCLAPPVHDDKMVGPFGVLAIRFPRPELGDLASNTSSSRTCH